MPARTTIDAARCRELLAKGLTQTQVAARLGVSVSKVSRVANERRCNRCNVGRCGNVTLCPSCQCQEFRLEQEAAR